MAKDYAIGVLAGLVSALLFGMLLKAVQTPQAILLYLLAPLPILIVGLGWGYRAGLAAVAAGALALGIGITPFLGLGFAVYLAIPAWWIAYLALLGRPGAGGGEALEWYPTGRLLAWVAGTAALAFVAIAVIAAPNYETFRTQITTMAKKVVAAQLQGRGLPAPPKQETAQESGETPPPAQEPAPVPNESGPPDLQSEVASMLAALAPGLAAQGLTILLTFYLWMAARIVRISGRLMRPWPDIPATMMPRGVLLIFAGGIALALVPGYPGVLGVALIGALSAAFALQGLAAFHDRSRGRPARAALLIGLYVILFLTQGAALLALTLFGIADTALAKRSAQGAARSP